MIEHRADYDERDGVLNLSGPTFYLRVRISGDDLASLSRIDGASWDRRSSIRAGEVLGEAVWWSVDDNGNVSVLVGRDDETWQVALQVPVEALLAGIAPA